MSRVINPQFRSHLQLGFDTAAWDALKAQVTAYLDSRAIDSVVDAADIRAVAVELQNDAVWNQIVSDMQLVVVPSR